MIRAAKDEIIMKEKMTIQRVEKNGSICAVLDSDETLITDSQSALDLLITAKYETGEKTL